MSFLLVFPLVYLASSRNEWLLDFFGAKLSFFRTFMDVSLQTLFKKSHFVLPSAIFEFSRPRGNLVVQIKKNSQMLF